MDAEKLLEELTNLVIKECLNPQGNEKRIARAVAVRVLEEAAKSVDGWHRHCGALNATQLGDDEWFRAKISAHIRSLASSLKGEA